MLAQMQRGKSDVSSNVELASINIEDDEDNLAGDEDTGLVSETRVDRPADEASASASVSEEGEDGWDWRQLTGCAIGLQVSYLTWGMLQERVMTSVYESGEKFPSANFCVFSNRVMAIMLGAVLMFWDQRDFKLAAPLYMFAPAALSNTLSSYGQYEALHYVSFPLQTLSKSFKVLPVMAMGKVLNGRAYPWVEYGEAVVISIGVSIFALGGPSKDSGQDTVLLGVLMLTMYLVFDAFTGQYQSRVFKGQTDVTQFQMMFAVNTWAILFTLIALFGTGEWWITMDFLGRNPAAIWDNIGIAITSATGQLFIFYTIKKFGPVVFTLIMTCRQMLSMVISSIIFVHPIGFVSLIGAALVFATLFYRARRNMRKAAAAAALAAETASPTK